MLQTSPIKKEIFKTKSNPISAIEEIKNYIKSRDCKNITIDISNLNIIDASRTAIICSTYHYMKHQDGSINWIVSSPEVKRISKSLNLGNAKFSI